MADQWDIPEGWETVDPQEITSDGENPNQMKKKQKDALLLSLQTDGWLKPIVVNMDLLLVDGEQKWDLAKADGQKLVPIRRVDVDDAQRRILRQVLNRLQGTDDEAILSLNYRKIDADGMRQMLIRRLVLSEKDLRLALEGPKGPSDDYELPMLESVETDIELGDRFSLGDHILLCGDSTDSEYLDKLMGDIEGDCVFTDPPWGVGYEGGTKKQPKLIGDETTALYDGFLSIIGSKLKDTATLYICHAGVKSRYIQEAIEKNSFEVMVQIIWVKNHAQFGNLWIDYKQKHEPIFYCRKKGVTQKFYGKRNEVSVWNIPRASKNKYHPTQKPIDLCSRAIVNSTMPGMTVLDVFGGSGSTMVACEQTGRRCYMMEIDPRYCQIIIDRWEAYTGMEAEKILPTGDI